MPLVPSSQRIFLSLPPVIHLFLCNELLPSLSFILHKWANFLRAGVILHHLKSLLKFYMEENIPLKKRQSSGSVSCWRGGGPVRVLGRGTADGQFQARACSRPCLCRRKRQARLLIQLKTFSVSVFFFFPSMLSLLSACTFSLFLFLLSSHSCISWVMSPHSGGALFLYEENKAG